MRASVALCQIFLASCKITKNEIWLCKTFVNEKRPCLGSFNILLKIPIDIGKYIRHLINYLLAAGFATTSPVMLRYFSGVTAFDFTTIVLLNDITAAAL
jgi:hypothetical protein